MQSLLGFNELALPCSENNRSLDSVTIAAAPRRGEGEMMMNKKLSVAVLVLGCLSLLAACQPSNVVSKVKQHTVTVLNQKDQVWRENEAVSATVTSQGV